VDEWQECVCKCMLLVPVLLLVSLYVGMMLDWQVLSWRWQ
jgi:hypothetical protein